MSQRKIPESSFSEQHDESDDKSKRKWVIKWNTVTHHGKIKIKMERRLDLMTWLDEEWGTASRLCVSHSESIAKLGWVVLKLSVKSSEGWNLMCWSMMLHNQSWCSISFIPHYSFFFSLPSACLSLASRISLPVTNIASFRTIERVQKDVPTTTASNSLLKQVMIAYLEG